ncbi:hypothetical protein DEO72_LG7g454 [Vigna unguiculata]|nr:hypothetical protein DEO72_LG7g454 [Vigna unguiculata]
MEAATLSRRCDRGSRERRETDGSVLRQWRQQREKRNKSVEVVTRVMSLWCGGPAACRSAMVNTGSATTNWKSSSGCCES